MKHVFKNLAAAIAAICVVSGCNFLTESDDIEPSYSATIRITANDAYIDTLQGALIVSYTDAKLDKCNEQIIDSVHTISIDGFKYGQKIEFKIYKEKAEPFVTPEKDVKFTLSYAIEIIGSGSNFHFSTKDGDSYSHELSPEKVEAFFDENKISYELQLL